MSEREPPGVPVALPHRGVVGLFRASPRKPPWATVRGWAKARGLTHKAAVKELLRIAAPHLSEAPLDADHVHGD